MNAIELKDVFRVHSTPEGDAAALQGLSLRVADGEVVTVLGPSGSGKSTLLRLLAGLDRPSAGLVRVYSPTASDNGRPIRGLVRSDFVVTEKEADHSLADRDHRPYAVLDPDSLENVLTVRDSVEGPRRIIPRNQWGFARDQGGQSVADTTRVHQIPLALVR